MPAADRERRRRGVRTPIALALLAILAALAAVEVAVRVFDERLVADPAKVDQFQKWARAGHPLFVARPYIGWAHHTGKDGVAADGFLGARPPRARTANTLRISCLGASTTVAYPRHLARELRERGAGSAGPAVEVVNWAVHGWTTAETMTNYFLNVQDYQSDIVLYLHAWNDVRPRITAGRRPDYSHYRTVFTEPDLGAVERWLLDHSRAFAAWRASREDPLVLDRFTTRIPPSEPEALLDPETMETFLRNVRTVLEHVESTGGHFVLMTLPCRDSWQDVAPDNVAVLGSHTHNRALHRLAREKGVPLIDLYQWARENDDVLHEHFKDLIHFDTAGEKLKAAFIAAELERMGLLPSPRAGD